MKRSLILAGLALPAAALVALLVARAPAALPADPAEAAYEAYGIPQAARVSPSKNIARSTWDEAAAEKPGDGRLPSDAKGEFVPVKFLVRPSLAGGQASRYKVIADVFPSEAMQDGAQVDQVVLAEGVAQPNVPAFGRAVFRPLIPPAGRYAVRIALLEAAAKASEGSLARTVFNDPGEATWVEKSAWTVHVDR